MKNIEIEWTNTSPMTYSELIANAERFGHVSPWCQLDIADGVFVSNKSWPYNEGQMEEIERLISAREKLPMLDTINYEVHMMIEHPQEMGILMANLGCKRIMPHVEAFESVESFADTVSLWKEAGAKEIAIAVLIDTPIEDLEPYLEYVDCVQLMSIATLGVQGAAFDDRIYDRIRELRALDSDLTIAVDGGVNMDNIRKLSEAGANAFGVGSAICKAPDPRIAYESLFKQATL